MIEKFKKVARRSKTAIICYRIYDNYRMRKRYSRGEINASMGSTHSNKSIAESLSYIDQQYDDYKNYAALEPSSFSGKRILELGCGDNVGVALRFLAQGAQHLVCIDKYYAVRDVEKERQIYLEMRSRMSAPEQTEFDKIIDLSKGIELNSARLSCVYGKDLGEYASEIDSEEDKFDIILSRAVIEEIYDPEPIFQAADKLLRSSGIVIHKIDLSDYGMFSDAGMNPLTFLSIPEWIYRRMAAGSGTPNRKLIGYYRNLMTQLGYEAKFFVSSIVGKGDLIPHKETLQSGLDYGESERSLIAGIRPKLIPSFAHLPEEELVVSGIFLVAGKVSSSN